MRGLPLEWELSPAKCCTNVPTMAMRIIYDEGKPSAAMEIPLEKPLPDYDLEQIDQPTPRDVDSILISQGFRDLVDDARGVLMELLAHEPPQPSTSSGTRLDLTHCAARSLEIAQLTGWSVPLVKVRAFRARAEMRKLVAKIAKDKYL